MERHATVFVTRKGNREQARLLRKGEKGEPPFGVAILFEAQ